MTTLERLDADRILATSKRLEQRVAERFPEAGLLRVCGQLVELASRAKATMSGGTDFIAKPFLFIEITLKALTLILRSRLPTIVKCA